MCTIILVQAIRWRLTKSADIPLDKPSVEIQNIGLKLDVRVVSQQTSCGVWANEKRSEQQPLAVTKTQQLHLKKNSAITCSVRSLKCYPNSVKSNGIERIRDEKAEV
jgi:hypothetical protein